MLQDCVGILKTINWKKKQLIEAEHISKPYISLTRWIVSSKKAGLHLFVL